MQKNLEGHQTFGQSVNSTHINSHTQFTRTDLAAVAPVFDYILVIHIT